MNMTTCPQRTVIHKGPVVDLGIETAQLPDGRTLELEVVRHPGGAAVVAVNAARQVCLLHQYRHAAGGWLWELPAGKLDTGEDAATTARRELAEEAGVEARRWHKLGEVFTTPGFCDEVIHLYLAEDLQPVPTRHQDNELIDIHWIDMDEARAWVRTGELRDAKSILGLTMAAARHQETTSP